MSLLAAAVISTLLAACGGGAAASRDAGGQVNRSGTLRVALHYALPHTDPHRSSSPIAAFPLTSLIYDRLTQIGPNRELLPMLATTWEFAPDGRSVTFTLREGVTFSDGAALDAEAVRASLERAMTMSESTVKGYLSDIEAVEVVDPRTVRMTTTYPTTALPYVLAGSEGSIISPQALDNPDLDRNPVGSGPFILADIRVNERATLERRPDYWDPEAGRAARIELAGLQNDNARLNALRSNQYDLAFMTVGQLDHLSRLGDEFVTKLYDSGSFFSVALNTDQPNIDNVLVRQALNWAVDRDAINNSLLGGRCTPLTQPLTPAYRPGHLVDPPIAYAHDPEKAKVLLAEAGVPQGFDMKLLVGAGQLPDEHIATAIQEQLAQIGVRVEVVPQEPSQRYPNWTPGSEYEANLFHRPAKPTAAMTLQDQYLSPGRYPGKKPDGFAEAVQRALDPLLDEAAATQALEQASRIGNENAMDIFLCGAPPIVAYSRDIVGADTMALPSYASNADLRYVGVTRG
jgi:peptide/nickel transport system substrate-binding protein